MKSLKIGNIDINTNRTFIIAEIGINHQGDINIAKKLIDVAKEAGCDAVKFQKRNPYISIPEHQKNIIRETPWGIMTYLEYKNKIEFGKKEYDEIDRYCKEKGIMWFASVWDEESVDFLEQYNIPCYKIPSAHLTNIKLLLKVSSINKPIILSTGMSTTDEIDKAAHVLRDNNIILMHCHATYPCKDEEVNLKVIKSLKDGYDVLIGYSGHEDGIFGTEAAVVLGAVAVERHITLNRGMWGTDQAASLEPRGLNMLVRDIRRWEKLKGDGIKRVYDSEIPVRKKLRGI